MRVTYIDPRATFTACKATRYWQVRPNSDYALNLAIIHEVLKQEAYDKDFVARFVSGMDYLARRSRTRRRNGRSATPAFLPSSCAPSSRRSPPMRHT